jgi:DNA-binding response OmpR family regulator
VGIAGADREESIRNSDFGEMMPGHQAARTRRQAEKQSPWGLDMFIVALTGWGQEEDRRKSVEAGFDDHFVKPVDSDKLLSRLRTVSGSRA